MSDFFEAPEDWEQPCEHCEFLQEELKKRVHENKDLNLALIQAYAALSYRGGEADWFREKTMEDIRIIWKMLNPSFDTLEKIDKILLPEQGHEEEEFSWGDLEGEDREN